MKNRSTAQCESDFFLTFFADEWEKYAAVCMAYNIVLKCSAPSVSNLLIAIDPGSPVDIVIELELCYHVSQSSLSSLWIASPGEPSVILLYNKRDTKLKIMQIRNLYKYWNIMMDSASNQKLDFQNTDQKTWNFMENYKQKSES